MNFTLRQIVSAGALLALTALLAAGLLAGVKQLTAERIAEAERQTQLRALAAVLPRDRYDNDPLADAIVVRAPAWLGGDAPLPVWRARLGAADAQLVLRVLAPDGYSGSIVLLVGVQRDGRIAGVRVIEHRETPGLGDAIEAEKSDWIDRFIGRGLGAPPPERWAVRKDGGDFDTFTGATITPRAVVGAIHRALAFVEKHGDTLYAAAAGTELRFDDAPSTPRRTR
jgi:electron transport complex protein RnfG